MNNSNTVSKLNTDVRSKKFTCLNYTDESHKRIAAAQIYKNFNLDDGYFSFYGRSRSNRNNMYDIVADHYILNQELAAMQEMLPINLTNESGKYHPNDLKHLELHLFNDSYINIVVESVMSTNFLTEKTYKPIANLQPFVLVAGRHSLKELHALGYKTFDKWIDESYDDIEDNWTRAIAAVDAATEFLEEPERICEMENVLIHNRNLFFNAPNRLYEALTKMEAEASIK